MLVSFSLSAALSPPAEADAGGQRAAGHRILPAAFRAREILVTKILGFDFKDSSAEIRILEIESFEKPRMLEIESFRIFELNRTRGQRPPADADAGPRTWHWTRGRGSRDSNSKNSGHQNFMDSITRIRLPIRILEIECLKIRSLEI